MTTRTRTHNLTVIGIVFAIAAGIALVALLMAPDRNSTSPVVHNSPVAAIESGLILPLVHLDGNWTVKENDTTFNATVAGESIKIEMVGSEGVSATYWHGTFKTSESAGTVVTSTKTEAPDEIVISQSSTKEFTVGQNSLTFKFSALGFSKNLEMTRG
jgi:hypothetical protein